jgi:crotonobetainyl-CoA:carnitine CoA-transferase CaiB-like acyl-CoA transferase
LYAAIGILAALHHRNVTGAGQYIDLALLDTVVGMMANQGQNYFVGGKPPGRTGAEHPNLAPYRTFATSDGYAIIAVGNDGQFRKLCGVLGLDALADDARFVTNADRVRNRRVLAELIEAQTAKWPMAKLVDALSAVDVPSGPINSLDQVFEDPQVKHRELRVTLPHPLGGEVAGIRNPLRFSATPAQYGKAPPLLGQHTEEVLSRVAGLTAEEIARLRDAKVV